MKLPAFCLFLGLLSTKATATNLRGNKANPTERLDKNDKTKIGKRKPRRQSPAPKKKPGKPLKKKLGKTLKSNISPTNKIVGGTEVDKPVPYFGLWNIGCGASLIHDDILLSAAHCDLDDIFAGDIRLGGLQVDSGLSRRILDSIPHPQYSSWTNEFDFLILKLNTTALEDYHYSILDKENGGTTVSVERSTTSGPFPTGLQPIPINRNASVPQDGDPLLVMGFGVTDVWDGGLTDSLQEVEVYHVPDQECRDAYGYDFENHNMMCAGRPGGGADTCQGDSGGPMVTSEGVLVGVTSFGEGCGEPGYPGVYAQVDAVADWIDEEICKNSCYPPDTCDPATRHPCADAATNSTGVALEEGTMNFTIAVTLDSYPSEFGALLTHVETGTELWYVGYNTYNEPNFVVEETFSNLPGGIYHLMVGDLAWDGLYGEGGILIQNSAGDELWSDTGDYGSSEEVYLNITADGTLVWAANNPDGTITGGWPHHNDGSNDFDDDWTVDDDSTHSTFDPEEEDSQWPGLFPSSNSTNAITINIRTDSYPGEITWEWSERTGIESWNPYDSGIPLRDDTLFSYTKLVKSDTIYRLRITDSANDGTCCSHGNGWFTITNATASKDHDEGTVIWKKTGDEFRSTTEVFLWIDPDGMAQEVVYIKDEGFALVHYTLVRLSTGDVARDAQSESEAKQSPKKKTLVDRFVPGWR